MRRWGVVLALLLSVGLNVGIGVALLARGGGERPEAPGEADAGPGRLPPGVRRVADELGLDGERRRSFFAAQERFFERTLLAHERLRTAQAALRDELVGPDPQRSAVAPWLAEMKDAHGELEQAFVDSYFELRAILGPAETRRFLERVMRHRERRQGLLGERPLLRRRLEQRLDRGEHRPKK